jgi:hypothetical protein
MFFDSSEITVDISVDAVRSADVTPQLMSATGIKHRGNAVKKRIRMKNLEVESFVGGRASLGEGGGGRKHVEHG